MKIDKQQLKYEMVKHALIWIDFERIFKAAVACNFRWNEKEHCSADIADDFVSRIEASVNRYDGTEDYSSYTGGIEITIYKQEESNEKIYYSMKFVLDETDNFD